MIRKTDQSIFQARRQSLIRHLKARRLAGMLVTDPANIFYLTGFRGSAGTRFVGPDDAVLWVDPRYTLQAREQASDVEVTEVKTGLLRSAGRWLNVRGYGRVGYEDTHLTCQQFSMLGEIAGRELVWVPLGRAVEMQRAVKDPGEIETIRRACKLASKVYEEVAAQIRPGVSERDLAAEIEYKMKRHGAEGAAFDTIVASGRRSAFPHATPSPKLLEKGDLVILDLGAILGGYASDMTRTVYLGRPGQRIRRLYSAVQEAQLEAVKAAVPGTGAATVDAVARRVLARRGLHKYFTHSTGHGVGIEIHEDPKLGKLEATKLKEGFVITVEPGVYLEELGGIRIEDTLVVSANGPEVLTTATRNQWIID